MMTQLQLIDQIKSSPEFRENAHFTLDQICELCPQHSKDEVVGALLELDDVNFTDASLGGITIPGRYFK